MRPAPIARKLAVSRSAQARRDARIDSMAVAAPPPPCSLNSIDGVVALAELMLMFLESRPATERVRLERRIVDDRGFDAAMASSLQTIHDVAVSCLLDNPDELDSISRRLHESLADGDDDLRRMALFGLSDYAPDMFKAARAQPDALARH